MKAIRFAVQNLIGGVSQHPNSSRLENQCEVQDNAYSSLVDGLGKRQPSEHVQWLDLQGNKDSNAFADAKYHWIDSGENQRYLAIFHSSFTKGFAVYDVSDGTLMNTEVDDNDARRGYLYSDLGDGVPVPKDDFRCVSVGDTTYVVNRKRTTAKDATETPHDQVTIGAETHSKSARRWFLAFLATNYLTDYRVRLNTQTGANYTVPAQANFWDPPIEDYNNVPKETWLKESEAWVKTFNGDYSKGTHPNGAGYGTDKDQPPYSPPADSRGYMVAWLKPSKLLDLLYRLNKEGTGARRYHGGIVAAYNEVKVLTEGLDGATPGASLLRLPAIVNNVMKVELRSDIADTHPYYRDSFRIAVIDSGEGAQLNFSTQIGDAAYATGNGGLQAFSTEVQSINQLPLICEHGHIVKITGIEELENDDYYVKFVQTDAGKLETTYPTDNMGQGYWEESLGPLVTTQYDLTTMPIELERIEDAGAPKGYKFRLKVGNWTARTVGDDESNPFPSFIGEKISDIFLWRNRLGLLAGSRIVMSEADEYGNFFRTTVKQLLDSDPIDRDASLDRPVVLQYAVPLEEQLVVFSDRTQFLVTADPILTPKTASVLPVTYFEASRSVRPLAVERGIFFPYQAGGEAYSQIRQMRRIVDSDNFDAFPATSQVPRYIKGDVVAMAATSVESALAVITNPPGEKNYVYIYKWQDVNGNRVLSAWQRFDLGPSGEYGAGSPYMYATEVAALTFFKDSLYMVVKRRDGRVHGSGADQYHLEKITFSGPRQPDTYGYLDGDLEEECRVFLDRRITEADCTVTYDSTNKEMRIRLPYSIQTDVGSEPVDDKMVIMQRAQATDGPTLIPWDFTTEQETVGSRTYSVLKVEDKSGALYAFYTGNLLKWYVGQKYTMTYQFSEPSLREPRRDGTLHDIKTGRLTLLRGHLAYEDSGYLKVTVAPRTDASGDSVVSRDTWEYVVPFLEMGMGATELGGLNIRDGVLPFGINAQPGHCTITVTNDTPYPSNPKSLELEASYTRRSRMYSR